MILAGVSQQQQPAQPGRRVVIKDVAARAGVAIATVSRVLSGSTDVRADLRERVLRAAAELDYQPDILAQSLRRGATRSVGFIADDLPIPHRGHRDGRRVRPAGPRLFAAGHELGA